MLVGIWCYTMGCEHIYGIDSEGNLASDITALYETFIVRFFDYCPHCGELIRRKGG